MVGFVDAVKMFFGRYTDFKGRSSRSEYWWVALFNILVMIIPLMMLMGSYGGNLDAMEAGALPAGGGLWVAILAIYCLAILIPSIALVVRRFHDLNQTGWLYLLVGMLASLGMLVWFAMRGTIGDNKYGADPVIG